MTDFTTIRSSSSLIARSAASARSSMVMGRIIDPPPTGCQVPHRAELPPQHRPLGIPEVEAANVKLHGLPGLAEALHHVFAPLDGEIAGAAGLVVPAAAPDAPDADLRQASVEEFFSNERAERVVFHRHPPDTA